MLDLVLIFSTSGVVLWSRRLSSEADAVARQFVQDVLLSDHAGQATYSRGQYALKWARSNTAGVVFVAAYLNQITLHYVDAFLDRLRSAFLERFAGVQLDSAPVSTFADFDAPYDRILQKHEQSGSNVARKPAAAPQPPADTAARPEPDLVDQPAAAGDDAAPRTAADDGPMSALDKLKARGVAGRRGRGAAAPSGSTRKAGATAAETTKPKKPAAKRNWNNATLKTAPSDAPATALDHGQARPDDDDAVVGRVSIPSAGAADDDSGYDTSDVEDDVDGTTRSSVFGYFQGLIGKRLEADDLAPALDKVRTNLMTKNVAADIADDICGSVSASLVGRTLSSLQIGSAVRAAIEETLTRVLSKSHDDGDLLRKIRTVNEQEGRPYSVVFVGVNGVGKSTSLAKICYYLLSKQLTVSLVACDTFRAGAVEQLKTHANALGVELFQRGYNRDPAGVASEGIEAARRAKNNVVLVDTAGRMQDNEPLMRALSKLIIQNRPDLVLFVGEALVGNDGVDQLTKFNLALSDLSTEDTPRLIDGIVLTKFDTIDDKVGAAISMTYTAGIPIMFVGCGQDYADMRRMNVKSVIKKLLK